MENSKQECSHDYGDYIRKGRAHYVCPKCLEDITLEVVLMMESREGEMQREIKFRAWDKEAKEFNLDLTLPLGRMSKNLSERFILEQFTGLHDNTKWDELSEEEKDAWVVSSGNLPNEWKGREIFEGDVAEFQYYDNDLKGLVSQGIVKWNNCGFYLGGKVCVSIEDKHTLIIIGNIHQDSHLPNPELLK